MMTGGMTADGKPKTRATSGADGEGSAPRIDADEGLAEQGYTTTVQEYGVWVCR